jgi:hypothetical protein
LSAKYSAEIDLQLERLAQVTSTGIVEFNSLVGGADLPAVEVPRIDS